ncbi:MAG: transcriptional regulator [Dehalococcoidia bacterium]|nr:transcriptional regulator [Dehalococcoidia bacterium]
MDIVEVFRKKFETYRKVMDESGEEKAWQTLFQGYPERQRANMGRLIEGTSLAEGFTKGIPLYKQLGMEMQVVDISSDKVDAVLEIQRTCPALKNQLHKQFGFDKPCKIICDMDIAATNAAFPGMKGKRLASMAEGDVVCIFKYERPKK